MSREVLDVCFKSQMLSEMSPNCLLVGPECRDLPSPDPGASAMGPPQNLLDCLLSLLLSGPVQTYKCVYYSASQWAPLRNLLFDILA